MKDNKKEFITKTMLKERGWTDSLIKEFLPEPHKTSQNTYYRSAPPICLYKILIVKKIEKTKKFSIKFEKAQKRKRSAQKAVETKLNKLKKYVEEVDINVPKMSKNKLIKSAIKHYNEMQEEREYLGLKTCGQIASKNSDQDFLNRITVNYIRHCLTIYEEELNVISGKIGVWEGYVDIKEKVFDEISNVYPWLRNACDLQRLK